MSGDFDVLIVGSGAAGLTAALNLAPDKKVGVIANEPTRDLLAKAQEKAVVVTIDRDLDHVPANSCFDNIVLVDERTLQITYRKDQVNAGQVLGALTSDGLSIVDVSTRDPDLEDVFLSLTREAAA